MERVGKLGHGIQRDRMVAEYGQDINAVVKAIEASGARSVIPPRFNRKERLTFWRFASILGLLAWARTS
jgi:hypothetical protein